MSALDACPLCGANLVGERIKDSDPPRFYRRAFGVEIRGVYDGVLFWACPDCGGAWHRFEPGDPYRARAERHMLRYAAAYKAEQG